MGPRKVIRILVAAVAPLGVAASFSVSEVAAAPVTSVTACVQINGPVNASAGQRGGGPIIATIL